MPINKVSKYNNKNGMVSSVELEHIIIDGIEIPTRGAYHLIARSHVTKGDSVEFNTKYDGSLIYLRVTKCGRNHPYFGGESRGGMGISEDPEDGPLGYDLDAMGYHHLGMEE
jgi:signal peptidase I